jgi:hypothetical protein
MPLPSLYVSSDKARAWSVTRAAACGAAVGALAGLFKTLAALHQAIAPGGQAGGSLPTNLSEILGAALGFALLCAGAAAVRNFIARRLIWPEQS